MHAVVMTAMSGEDTSMTVDICGTHMVVNLVYANDDTLIGPCIFCGCRLVSYIGQQYSTSSKGWSVILEIDFVQKTSFIHWVRHWTWTALNFETICLFSEVRVII